MKYAIAILALAVGVFALPQDSASITSAPVASPSLTPAVSCIHDCPAGDVTCQAACQGIARPNSSQAVETNECAAKCDQGDGSASDTKAYAACQQDCFAKYFPSSQTNFGGAAGAVASVTSAVSGAVSSGASAARSVANSATSSGASSGSPTGSAAETSETAGSANANAVKIAGAGLAGLLAIFAL